MDGKRPRRRTSMKLVFSVTNVILVVLTVVGVFAVTDRNARHALQQEMETRLLMEARHLSLLSTDALLSDYPELTLCPLVSEMLQQQPDLEFAVVLDHESHIKGHSDVRRLGEKFSVIRSFEPYASLAPVAADEALITNDTMLAAKVPARHPTGQVLGSVVVAQNRDHINAMLAANRHQVIVLAAALAIVAMLAALLVVNRILAPLDTLRAGLARIGRGDLDSPIRLRSRTELALLANTIDSMASQLKTSQDEALAKEQEVIATQGEIIHTLGEVVESRSHETGNHIDRVAESAGILGYLADLPTADIDLLRMAAPMHDVGKIGIPDAVLNKPGKLTTEEFDLMKTHAALGYEILSDSDRPVFKAAALIAHEHHERWDGHGYPRGIAGENIHVFARIVSIVDVFDALTSDRCYRPAMQLAEALAIMIDGRGTQFDPELLDLFFKHLDRFRDLTEKRIGRVDANDLAGPPVPPAPVEVASSEPVLTL